MSARLENIPLPPIDVSRFRVPFPSDIEVLKVQQHIQDAQHDIDQCNLEIENLRNTIFQMEEQRNHTRYRIDEYRAFISPIRKVPVEIWTEIFSLCLPHSYGLRITDHKIFAPVLDLSHVCGSWRAIALSTPKLWSSLDINLAHGGLKMVRAAKHYLDCSKTFPLNLNLIGPGMDDDDLGFRVFSSLLDAHTRWSKIEIDLPWKVINHKVVENFLKTVSIHCDILQSFSIVFGYDWSETDESSPHLFRMLERAPQLKSLHLDIFGSALILPFSQLRDITVACFVGEVKIADCFSKCLNLEKANITIEDMVSGTREIALPKLFFLRCQLRKGYYASSIFSMLTLPAISMLDLSISEDFYKHASSACNSLCDLLSRSLCHLETLILGTGFYASDRELIRILSIVPTLIHLELDSFHCRDFTATFFQALTLCTKPEIGILPRLSSFQIRIDERRTPEIIEDDDVSLPEPELILLMVKSRRLLTDFQPKLTSFDLVAHLDSERDSTREDWVQFFASDAEPGLRALEEEGLKLVLDLNCFKK
ncbi:hypothetical protein VKT23_009089 [Stygiomarasmius scandens]|uniref:F-box domain-containing protein n=1 Tax=Marasmiellus scandens TaxID=2682957 RepID=A0ABR1JJL2_9AGAR